MLEKKKGVIINFSSIAGAVGMGRGANAYCASKGGVNTLTKQLALEWASRGIRVNAIAPCQFMTPGLQEVIARSAIRSEKAHGNLDDEHTAGQSGRARKRLSARRCFWPPTPPRW